MEVMLDTQVTAKSECFKYLGSIIQGNRKINNDIIHSIGAGWMKWRLASGVLYDKNVLQKLKGKFYRVVGRSTILHEAKCWPVKNSHVQKMKIVKMRLLRWMCEHTSRYKIRNKDIRDKVGVAYMVDKMRKARLRMFEHVKRSAQIPNREPDIKPLCARTTSHMYGTSFNDISQGNARGNKWISVPPVTVQVNSLELLKLLHNRRNSRTITVNT
nr:uncharacterized protein LOC104110708 [Nicotiana tomentosiformis]